MTNNLRSINTIRTNTSIISNFPFKIGNTEHMIEVRCMLSRKNIERQHFIITFEKAVNEALEMLNPSTAIFPVCEAVFRSKQVILIDEPIDNFKGITEKENDVLKQKICQIINEYIMSNFH